MRPILSDSQPKKMKNGVPIANATAIMICAVMASTFSVWVRKNNASNWLLDRAQDIGFTDQQQRFDFPEDCGFALVHLWENRDSNWRAA